MESNRNKFLQGHSKNMEMVDSLHMRKIYENIYWIRNIIEHVNFFQIEF